MSFIKDIFRTKIEKNKLIFVDIKSKTLKRVIVPMSQVVTFSSGMGGNYITTKDGKEYKLLPLSKIDKEFLKNNIG